MKTSVVLDEKKLSLAKKLGNIQTTREILDKALEEFIHNARRKSMLGLLGKNFFDTKLAVKLMRK